MTVAQLPAGTKGFDCNTRVVHGVAALFYAAGYRFVVRYVRREPRSSHDITLLEAGAILASGLSLMLVQHVDNPGWEPTAKLGRKYGQVAVMEAQAAAYPLGATLWCDLEGVATHSLSANVIGFCNAWYDQAKAAGFSPGLYVGDSCGLSARELYQKLRFKRYWSAYNLNRDNYPATRGVQMRQGEYPAPGKRVIGCPFEYDTDVIQVDAMGDTPLLWVPDFDR